MMLPLCVLVCLLVVGVACVTVLFRRFSLLSADLTRATSVVCSILALKISGGNFVGLDANPEWWKVKRKPSGPTLSGGNRQAIVLFRSD